ncbi:apolipoprotein D-like [Artemia franciscana]
MYRVACFIATFALVSASCPNIATKPDFDYTQYAGDWFEISRIENWFQRDMYCVRARYGATDEPGVVSVYNVATQPDGEFTSITGSASAPNASAPGSLVVEFPGQPDGSYWVLDTDYTSWSAVYSCDNFGGLAVEFGWVLARENAVTEDVYNRAMSNFAKYGIDTSLFQKFYHGDDCVYDEPETPQRS